MEVKGEALHALSTFVKEKYGDAGYTTFLEALPPASKAIYSQTVLVSNWYSFNDGLKVPTATISKVFANNDPGIAREMGWYSADHGLKGVYRLLVKLGSPAMIAKRASSVFSNYYRPSVMVADSITDKSAVLRITQFEEIDPFMEQRIAGWVQRAIELCNCKNPKITLIKSMVRGDGETAYQVTWE